MPAIRGRYPSYASFGASRLEEIFDPAELAKAEVREARTFESAVALNDGRGRFTLQPLALAAQVAPVFASLAADVTGDGRLDLLLAGNQYGAPPVIGRYDASRGTLLIGDGRGGFTAAPASGTITIDGQIRGLAFVRRVAGRPLLAVARNGSTLQLLSLPAFTPPAAPQ
jgi:hypothetical protein